MRWCGGGGGGGGGWAHGQLDLHTALQQVRYQSLGLPPPSRPVTALAPSLLKSPSDHGHFINLTGDFSKLKVGTQDG